MTASGDLVILERNSGRELARLRCTPTTNLRVQDLCLDNAELAGHDLRQAVFERCSLRHADMSRCGLDGAKFVEVDLTGANIAFAALDGVYMQDVVARGLKAYRACMAFSTLDEVDARESSLVGISLNDSSVSHSRFDRCDLAGADLRSAKFGCCSFDEATLTELLVNDRSYASEPCTFRGAVFDKSSSEMWWKRG